MIPFNRPELTGQEISNITESVINGHISGVGPFTELAEIRLAELIGSQRVLLTTSCTHALELAARTLEIGPGDEVIVPAFTFVSTAAAIAMSGAKPVFVDVLPETLNLDPKLVELAVTPRTKAVFTVHYAGIAQDLNVLVELCNRMSIPLIEDNAHGLGAKFMNKNLGLFGSMSTLSFHETKNITCGEGGALTLNGPEYIERAEILRDKGTNRSRFLRGQIDKYTWVDVGSSWVLSDILAAYLVAQLQNFDSIQSRRHAIWSTYNSELADWASNQGIRVPHIPDNSEHSAHMYYLHLRGVESRDKFIRHMASRGVMTVFHYQALNTSDVGRKFGGREGQCPVAEDAAKSLVRLPIYAGLTDTELAIVIDAIRSYSEG